MKDDLLRRAKRKAAAEGRTLTSLIEEGLRIVVGKPADRPRTPVRLPVSKATGGTVPGIDLNDSATLADVMESH